MAIPRQTTSSRAPQGTSVRVINAKPVKAGKASKTARVLPPGMSTRVSFTMLPAPVPIDRPQLTLWDKWRQDVLLLLFGLIASALVFKIIAAAYNL